MCFVHSDVSNDMVMIRGDSIYLSMGIVLYITLLSRQRSRHSNARCAC